MKRIDFTKAAAYRKKPIEVEAIQWDGNNDIEVAEFFGGEVRVVKEIKGKEINHYIPIKTLEGTMKASEKDFIIKGVSNEFYPCKPKIFLETYEEV